VDLLPESSVRELPHHLGGLPVHLYWYCFFLVLGWVSRFSGFLFGFFLLGFWVIYSWAIFLDFGVFCMVSFAIFSSGYLVVYSGDVLSSS